MKKFLVTQQFSESSQAVAAAYRSRPTWESFAGLTFVGYPALQSISDGDLVKIAMAYRVTMDLPPLAETFIDAKKLTFVEVTRLAADGSGGFEIVPDHYKKMLKASGEIEILPADDGRCERVIRGSVDVSLGWAGKLFEGPVEDAIVTGLSQALNAQAAQVGA